MTSTALYCTLYSKQAIYERRITRSKKEDENKRIETMRKKERFHSIRRWLSENSCLTRRKAASKQWRQNTHTPDSNTTDYTLSPMRNVEMLNATELCKNEIEIGFAFSIKREQTQARNGWVNIPSEWNIDIQYTRVHTYTHTHAQLNSSHSPALNRHSL